MPASKGLPQAEARSEKVEPRHMGGVFLFSSEGNVVIEIARHRALPLRVRTIDEIVRMVVPFLAFVLEDDDRDISLKCLKNPREIFERVSVLVLRFPNPQCTDLQRHSTLLCSLPRRTIPP